MSTTHLYNFVKTQQYDFEIEFHDKIMPSPTPLSPTYPDQPP